jgi:hypothetical protein
MPRRNRRELLDGGAGLLLPGALTTVARRRLLRQGQKLVTLLQDVERFGRLSGRMGKASRGHPER